MSPLGTMTGHDDVIELKCRFSRLTTGSDRFCPGECHEKDVRDWRNFSRSSDLVRSSCVASMVTRQKTVSMSLDKADARIGHPATPGSVAGVSRRTTRRTVRRQARILATLAFVIGSAMFGAVIL
jgi:hypothetical protein